MKANIAFASTGYGPLWAPVVSSWLRCIAYAARHCAVEQIGKIGGAGVTDRMYTMHAQNQLVQDMLDNDFTHLFLTESDMILPHDAIPRLLAHDADMASGVYFLRASDALDRGQPCIYVKAKLQGKEHEDRRADYVHTQVSLFPQEEPFWADSSGLGCLLVKRKVFEGLKKPWFETGAGSSYGGVAVSTDFYFTANARMAGFKLLVDPTVRPGQIDYYETTFEDYRWRLRNDPAFATAGFVIGGKNESVRNWDR